MITRWAVRFLLVVLVPSPLLAQNTQSGSPVTGDIRPIVLHSGVAETNAIFATLAGGAAVDDNNNNSVIHPIAGEQYFLDPSVAIQETRRHLAWDASYSPTLRVYVPSSSQRDVFNQSFAGALQYEATKRLGIGIRQDYLRTSDPFQQLGENPLQPGLGLGSRPGALTLPNFRRTELLSQAEINYRLTKHTSLGVDGAFKQIQGNEVGAQHTSLIDTHDTLGSAFLSHQFTARQAFGVQYQFLDIVFPGQDSHTVTHGVLLFDEMAITPHMHLAIFAGPEYSEIHNQLLLNFLGTELKIPVSSTLWSPSGGATFGWSGDRLGFLASYVRRISDGGGIEGAVELNDGLANLRWKVGQHWIADLNGEWNQHALLDQPGIYNLQVLELGAGVHYQLRQHLSVRAQYQRLHHIGGSRPLLLSGDHNRVTVGIERNFIFPIGR